MTYNDKPKPRSGLSDHAYATGVDSYFYESSHITLQDGSASFTPSPADLNSIFSTATTPMTMVVTCLICSDEHEVPYDKANLGIGFCELCRQAILLCRRQVLENMARDLAEMGDD